MNLFMLEQAEPRNNTASPVLSSIRVLEVGHYIAAPFCTRLLADLGADIIKIEPVEGDPVRQWGEKVDGNSLWWSMHGRNKRSVALNLKSPRAREILLGLVAECDVLVENFRPGHLEQLGLSIEALRKARPDLVICHISGYGQTGPGRNRAAFGAIAEAVGGLRYLTNHPRSVTNLPPARVGISIGDSVAGLYAAFGIMSALWRRDRGGDSAGGLTIDVALSESVLSLMEGMLPEYGALGKVKQPTGGGIATAAPTNAYPTRDGLWVLIAANSDRLFAKLAEVMKMPDLLQSSDYKGNEARVSNATALDAIIAEWSGRFDADELTEMLSAADIPNSKVYTAEDCVRDEQYIARAMVRQVEDPIFDAPVLQSGVVPHIPEAPGTIRWPGPAVGAHTEQVLGELLALSPDDISALRAEGAVG